MDKSIHETAVANIREALARACLAASQTSALEDLVAELYEEVDDAFANFLDKLTANARENI